MFVAIEGVIGVGKTSLARLLAEQMQSSLLMEVFEENPFLSAFYQDRERYAFQTQIFFLLNRYRQLQELSSAQALFSDYMFAKDAIFANLNLSGDELAMYRQVYEALAETLPQPDLVVYLRADTNVLMNRITMRDRPYERNMDRGYIEQLRQAYEYFFSSYDDSHLLIIDSNELDFVRNEDDRQQILNRIRGVMGAGPQQPALPGIATQGSPPALVQMPLLGLESSERRLQDFQQFHRALDEEKGFSSDVLLNFMLLQEEIGELAKALKRVWLQQAQLSNARSAIQEELADVLAYVLKIANYTGIDLEAAYIDKMARNRSRSWD